VASLDLADALEPLARFTFDRGGEGALHLIAGGLVVVAATSLRLLFARGTPAPEAPRRAVLTKPRPLPAASPAPPRDPASELARGRVAGRRCGARTLDSALDRMAEAGVGDARVLVSRANLKVIRVDRCRSCAGRARREGFAVAGGAPTCEFERGLLEGAFEAMTGGEARARETRCASRGDDGCVFEVVYG